MTHRIHESATGDTAAPSGQTSGLDTRDDTTSLTTLQFRVGHIRLKARIPGACIALEIPGPVAAQLLTIEEAQQLIGALANLIGDIERDLYARRHAFLRMIDQADGSAESYASKP